ncbi:MAG: winged helix-turn-helix transcriptional regulator [Candidatus Hodarchaeales archaeon]|jgi:predicted ArsR family transcriptional regulator
MTENQVLQMIQKPEIKSSDLPPVFPNKKKAIVHELDREVLDILEKEGPITRSKLVSLTGIARSTLYDSLLRLILKGFVASFSEDRRHRGRPKVFYKALN